MMQIIRSSYGDVCVGMFGRASRPLMPTYGGLFFGSRTTAIYGTCRAVHIHAVDTRTLKKEIACSF